MKLTFEVPDGTRSLIIAGFVADEHGSGIFSTQVSEAEIKSGNTIMLLAKKVLEADGDA